MHEVRLADWYPLGLTLSGRPYPRHQPGARRADLLHARSRLSSLGLRHPSPERVRQLGQRRLRVGGNAERDRVTAADLPGVVVDLHDAKVPRQRRALGVEEPGEDVRADDQERIALLQRLPDADRRREETASPERMRAREVRAPVDRLAVDPRAQQLGQRGQFRDGLSARHAVAGDDDRGASSRQELGGVSERRGVGPAPRGDRRRASARVFHDGAHQIHRQREEHRPRRRRQRDLERPAQRDGRILGPADLVRPLGERLGHPREVARENRLVHEEARVLLPGRHHQRRLGPRRVVEDRETVGEAGRHVDVDDADPSRRLRVPVGRRHRRGLLEPEHVLEPRVGQRVQEGKLGGARVAEEVADAGRSQDLHQHGGDIHAPSILPEQQVDQEEGPVVNSAAASASRDRREDTSRRWRPGWPATSCPRPSSASRHA